MIDRRYTEVYRPADGPMSLDAGRPSAKDAFTSAGFTLASLVTATLGLYLAIWSIPSEYGASKLWYILTAFGVLTMGFSLRFCWNMSDATVVSWQAYQIRLNQWHEVQLEAYKNLKGIEVVRSYSEFELSPKYPAHVLLAGLAVHYRVQRQVGGRSVPYSVRSLDDKLYIGADNMILIGELKGSSPEAMSKLFADLGWVRNRRGGASGDWVVTSTDELVESFIRNWSKRRANSRD